MLYVHGDVGQSWGVNIIESSHEGSIKFLTSLEQLTYVTAYNV